VSANNLGGAPDFPIDQIPPNFEIAELHKVLLTVIRTLGM